jgi:hypothetical protein
MAEESYLSPSSRHEEDELNNVPKNINSDLGDDDETEDEFSEVEGSDASEDGATKKKKKKKKVGCLLYTICTSILFNSNHS